MKNEQRFKCNVCQKTWTGMKMEHCTVCHETFNDTRAGDKHRDVAYTYTIVRLNGKLVQFLTGEPIPEQAKVVSENNQQRECLDALAMRTKGMNQEKNGAWNNGGNWSPSIYDNRYNMGLPVGLTSFTN